MPSSADSASANDKVSVPFPAMNFNYDVIVVGAGHAGSEAALVSARMGAKTALVTIPESHIAAMPCNPSVGGIAKSHLVFELDALGGEIGRNADYTGVQFRVLNTSRGPAVQANRVQCDKKAYSRRMQAIIHDTKNLTLIRDEIIGLSIRKDRITGVRTKSGNELVSKCVVLTPGTFVRGRIHVGDWSEPGGGNHTPSADPIGGDLEKLGFRMARLKTGTPPRIRKDSIDYSKMERQDGIVPAPFFSWEVRKHAGMFHVEHSDGDQSQKDALFHVEQCISDKSPWIPGSDQMPCYLTRTTERTHAVVHDNLKRSSLYGGFITGTGVRYCPSFEDKVVKFPDKTSHHVFIEPEGRETDLVYPNGISNSLPRDVQADLVHSIPGMETAEIVEWAYAIEYDFVDPTELKASLESKRIEGLFFGGQINGTTGYEEAAALGFMAGVNAAFKAAGKPDLIFDRGEAYIGVMIDDLVTRGVKEPYRMFTSRAERRLILRQDNARYRMFEHARTIGVVDPEMIKQTERYEIEIDDEIARLHKVREGGVPLRNILAGPLKKYSDMPSHVVLDKEVIEQIEIRIKYDGYIQQELREARRVRAMDHVIIPDDLDYWVLNGLKHESKEVLSKIRPQNIGQASRISGIRPSDIALLHVHIEQRRRMKEGTR